MRQCGDCAFPTRYAKLFEWRSDGTIVMKEKGAFLQLALLDADELQGLFDRLSEAIGFSVDHILVEAQRRVGKAILANKPMRFVKFIPRSRVTRPEPAIRAMMQFAARDLKAIGFGDLKLDSYRAGDHMTVRVRNACLAPRLAGSILGAYEVLEGIPATVEYAWEGDTLVIRLARADEKDFGEERLYLEEPRGITGTVSYQRCVRCTTPLKAAKMLEWDFAGGRMLNKATGHREVMFAVQSLGALQRELASELGAEVRDTLYDAQLELARESLPGAVADGRGSFWDGYLRSMALRGMGYPSTFSSSEDSVDVTISNAYNQTLYAARLAAALEARTGARSEIDWKRRDKEESAYSITGV